jgi:crossover junction endodeoxyribonuclease RusA
VKELKLTIPLEPPSVNHYVKHTRTGRHYVTKEATAFMQAVAIIANGRSVAAKAYEVTYTVYQGKGSKGDVANYEKCVGDGLVKAGVIHSDSAITDYHQHKRRDWLNPRTEIHIKEVA